MLGGSTTIHGNMWVRGSRHDFDMWSEMGAEGWSFEEVLPYFIRLEDTSAVKNADEGITQFRKIRKVTIIKKIMTLCYQSV